ncbi:hypothetical protein JG687_00008932 [Phytophthora cactorum]|uniref:Uncharacterized protein n=1 Tax=Phytophthora cactorum TaxID=29920 RepID=A0A8T1UBE9_9STRA|nr:hypothetical protein JG687_00008932 [Phytophthora cactorum]
MSKDAFRASVFFCASAAGKTAPAHCFRWHTKRRRPRRAFKSPVAPRVCYAHGSTVDAR